MLRRLYRKLRPIIVKGKNNQVLINCKCQNFVVRVFGNNNKIFIDKTCTAINSTLTIVGNNCLVKIKENCNLIGPCHIHMEDNGGLYVDKNTNIRGVTFVINNGNVKIGKNCMFSYDIIVRNNDGHKVFECGKENVKINENKDVNIGNHVWICQKASILKGASIGDDCIVAFGALVVKGCDNNSILAGNPAKVVKRGITWAK